jgi:hypothetical protein
LRARDQASGASRPEATLGIYCEQAGNRRIIPIDRRGNELIVPEGATRGAQNGELV